MKSKLLAIAIAFIATAASALADLAISNIEVLSGYPWKDVLIGYTITGSTDQPISGFEVTAQDNASGTTYACKTLEGADCTPGTHILKWKAQEDGAKFQSDNVVFTLRIMPDLGGVQLWADGPYWAECNVGATKPEEYGYYFWWGDTVGYKRNSANNGWVSVRDGSSFSFGSGNCPTYGKTTSQLQSLGYIDASGNLVAAHDAATAHLGAPWRMPTDAEWGALISNCDTEWTTRNGVSGRLVKGRGAYASKSIFLPAAGYGSDSNLYVTGSYGRYWSSTPGSGNSNGTWLLNFNSGSFYRDFSYRYYGQSVRPLRVFAPSGSYMVKYNANGGTGTMADESFTYGTVQALTANAFTRTGYTFAGWTTSASGAVVYGDRQSVSNLTSAVGGTLNLFAVWVKDGNQVDYGGVQLWENGPYWAECNVGASKPEECGYYFWWGDTVGYKRNADNNGWASVKDGSSFSFVESNCPTYDKTTSQLQSLGYIDASGNLVAAHDAATAHLGAPWRMPTDAEWGALISNCDTEWTTRNGVSGHLVKGRGAYASKSIFLPAAGYGYYSLLYYAGSDGYYWSSTPYSGYSDYAWNLYFNSGYFDRGDYVRRDGGQSVRPLRVFAQ